MKSTSALTFFVLSLGLVFGGKAVLAQPDPGTFGPLAGVVRTAEYDFGDTAFTPVGFPGPVEDRAVVAYPDAPGTFPLVVFLHGRHVTCFQGGAASLAWPCPVNNFPIPSHRGYYYIQAVLASWGYIVVSVSANGINARDNSTADLGANARAQLMQLHLDHWNTWNTVGAPPFGTLFVGKVNLNNVGTMGHSRGGEGVAAHYLYNQSLGSPYAINAVLPLAPVNFSRFQVTNTALEVILPYCDGDVSDLQGVHFVDDVRYTAGDPTAKHTTLVRGANHNFFNTVWTPGGWRAGTADDWLAGVPGGSADSWCGTGVGNGRLTSAQQRGVGRAYVTGFFRRYLGGELAFAPLFKGDAAAPPSALTSDIFQSYLPPDSPTSRRDVNRLLQDPPDLTTNFLGDAVVQNGLSPFDLCGGNVPQPQFCLPGQSNTRQPHTTPSAFSAMRGLSQLRFGWSAPGAFFENDIPAGSGDVSGYAAVQFRASVTYNDVRNPGGTPQDFSVTLSDGIVSATQLVSANSSALYFPPGDVPSGRPVPKVFLNTIRIPLAPFATAGVNLTNVQSVVFNFDQTTSGALLISDLQFAD